MIYRMNPALPPSAISKAAMAAHCIVDAAVQRVLACSIDERRRLLALDRLDMASTSELLARVRTEAEAILTAVWGAAPDLDIAPLGSGRRQARDCGGRIASVVSAYDPGDTYPGGMGEHRYHLWCSAHPEAARAIAALRLADLYPRTAADYLAVFLDSARWVTIQPHTYEFTMEPSQ